MAEENLSTAQMVVAAVGVLTIGGVIAYVINRSSKKAAEAEAEAQPSAPPVVTPAPPKARPTARLPGTPAHVAPPQSQLATVAAHFRTQRQRNVDDVTVLRGVAINPALSDHDRALARETLRQAGIAAPPPPIHRQAPVAWPAGIDVSMHGAVHPGDYQFADLWAHAPAQPMPQQHVATKPVTYHPFPMPQPTAHAAPVHPAEHDPLYWTNLTQRLGLSKPGDRFITVKEAQHYLNEMGGYQHLDEDDNLGPATQSALEAFQAAHHLPITGQLDFETDHALIYAVVAATTPQLLHHDFGPGF